jgi:hypothetical protein
MFDVSIIQRRLMDLFASFCAVDDEEMSERERKF